MGVSGAGTVCGLGEKGRRARDSGHLLYTRIG